MKNRITRRLLVLSLAIVCLLALSGSAVAAELPVKYEAPVVVVAASGTSTVARQARVSLGVVTTQDLARAQSKNNQNTQRLSMPLFRWVLTNTHSDQQLQHLPANTITLPDQPAF